MTIATTQTWTTPLSIITLGSPLERVLREPCAEVPAEMLDRVAAWAAEMANIPGAIGLAANQVGIPYRFFIERVDRGTLFKLFINPKVLKTAEPHIPGVEGCLSCPGKRVSVNRPLRVEIEAFDASGKRFVESARGLRARCWMHEIDHLDGWLIVDVEHL